MLARCSLAAGLALVAAPAPAHFQTLIPSADVLPEGGVVRLDLVFTHPTEDGPAMPMARPVRFGALIDGAVQDLTGALEPLDVGDVPAWTASHPLPAPAGAVFFVEPAPYWEPSEGVHIVHYAKAFVDSWSVGEGWDALVGLPVEIEPLTRPTGLWTGNLFSGRVLAGGEPVPFAEIEVEFVNDGRVALPNPAFVTQTLRADAGGVFHYATPFPGWWGFSALTESPERLPDPNGDPAPVEAGALIWVHATAPTFVAD
jgi:cobalt/nickel transport protein